MSYNVKKALDAHIALTALVAGDRESKYVLSSAVRIRFAGGLRKTRPVWEEYQEARSALVVRLGEKKKNEEGEEVYFVPRTSPNFPEFEREIKQAEAEDSGIEKFASVTLEELFGKEVVDPKTGEKKPTNQIDVEVLASLLDLGIVVDPQA